MLERGAQTPAKSTARIPCVKASSFIFAKAIASLVSLVGSSPTHTNTHTHIYIYIYMREGGK